MLPAQNKKAPPRRFFVAYVRMVGIWMVFSGVYSLPARGAEDYAVWQGKRFVIAYNPDNRPEGVSDADVIDALAHAAAAWAPCGIRVEFGGFTRRPFDQLDGFNVIGWQEKMPGLMALTLPQHLRRILLDADIRLNKEKLTNAKVLRQVVAHEVGHALGLFAHSLAPDSLMSETSFQLRGIDMPSTSDLALCRQRYGWK